MFIESKAHLMELQQLGWQIQIHSSGLVYLHRLLCSKRSNDADLFTDMATNGRALV